MAEKIFTLQWHVTAMCDQHCKHCYMYDEPTYVSELKNPLKYEDCVKIIDDFRETMDRWGVKPRINFSGGDPLLRKDFFKILEYTHKKRIDVGILGNPYHITLAVAKRMKSLGVIRYQVSIDGMEEKHDYLRRPGSFKASLKALRILKKAGIPTVVMFTLSKFNAEDLIPVIRLVDREGVFVFDFARLAPVGTGHKMKKQMHSPQEYRALLFKVFEEYLAMNDKKSRTNYGRKDHLWNLLYQELGLLGPLKDHEGVRVYGGCGVGVNLLVILTDGTVYACRRFPSPIGKVPDQKIADIFLNSKELNEYRKINKMKKCGKCELLKICRGCPAVAYGAKGSYFAEDPQCWKKI